jgi:hypothetical protein
MNYTLRQMVQYHLAFLVGWYGRLKLWCIEHIRHIKLEKCPKDK